MEYTSLLAGLEFSDHPECTDPGLAVLARIINDTVSDPARAGLALLAPALIDTTVTRPRPGPRRLGRGLRWIARQLRGAIAHAAAVHTALALSLAGHHLANHRDTALVALLDRATRAHRHRHRLPKIDSRPLHLGQRGAWRRHVLTTLDHRERRDVGPLSFFRRSTAGSFAAALARA